MEKLIRKANQGVEAIYDKDNSILTEWLHETDLASQGVNNNGLLGFRNEDRSNPVINEEGIRLLLSDLSKLESRKGREWLKQMLAAGGIGITGEVLAVRETLRMALEKGPITEKSLLDFKISPYELRFPIAMDKTPNCPNSGSPEWVSRRPEHQDRFLSFGPGKMPIVAGIVHEIRNAGGYAGSTPYNRYAPVPTPFSKPLQPALSEKLGDYLRQPSSVPRRRLEFRMQEPHWNDQLLDRSSLEKFLNQEVKAA